MCPPDAMNQQTTVSYAQLERAFLALGFTRRTVANDPPAVRYEHAASGAVISVPPFANDDAAMEHHLVAARTTLDLFGIADPFAFATELQKAG